MLITEFIEGIGRTSFTTPAARRVEKIMTGRTEGYVDMTTDLTFFSKRDETGAMPKYCVCAYLRRGKKFPDEELFPYGICSAPNKLPVGTNSLFSPAVTGMHTHVDGFMLCFYKNTDHVFNCMLLMQTATSGPFWHHSLNWEIQTQNTSFLLQLRTKNQQQPSRKTQLHICVCVRECSWI